MFFTQIAATLLVGVVLLGGVAAAQSAPTATPEARQKTCDLGGAIAGDRGERVVVTAWYDGRGGFIVGGFIVGRIIDANTKKPIVPGPRTGVAMYGPARGTGGSCQCTPVRADGTFRIRAPAGQNRIYLRAAMGYNEPSEYVTVTEDQDTEVVWKLVLHGKRRQLHNSRKNPNTFPSDRANHSPRSFDEEDPTAPDLRRDLGDLLLHGWPGEGPNRADDASRGLEAHQRQGHVRHDLTVLGRCQIVRHGPPDPSHFEGR